MLSVLILVLTPHAKGDLYLYLFVRMIGIGVGNITPRN
jgi:hypothetical protein